MVALATIHWTPYRPPNIAGVGVAHTCAGEGVAILLGERAVDEGGQGGDDLCI